MAIQQYQLAYQISPLYLTGGITGNQPSSIQPFLSYVMPGAFTILGPDFLPSAFQTYNTDDLNNAFGSFSVIPGGTLNKNTIAKYPFANQFVAANAAIREALNLSLIWDTPMRGPGAWDIKLATMTAIKKIFDAHVNIGGTFTIATPAYIYTNMLLTGLTDNSRGTVPLPQNAWRFDFERPLVVQAELQQAYNLNQQLLKMTNGLPSTGAITGIFATLGMPANSPQSNLGPNTPLPSNPTVGQVSGLPNNLSFFT
jgi:hypothetical protein